MRLARRVWGWSEGGRASLADAQAAASVGQIATGRLWVGLLRTARSQCCANAGDSGRFGRPAAIFQRFLHFGTAARCGAVPVVNENDSVATEEIRFGDNDRLAARVAQAAGAEAVVLLSDVDGLMDRDPAEEGATLVPTVRGVTDEIRAMADSGSASGIGSGGMTSKFQAAEIAERAGIAFAIINGTRDAPIGSAIASETGTLFIPTRSDGARRSWLGGRIAPAGSLTVDEGCIAAWRKGLACWPQVLPKVEGTFERGEVVSIMDRDGAQLRRVSLNMMRGLARHYAANAMRNRRRNWATRRALR